VLPISDPLDLNLRLEEVIQATHELLSLGIVQVLSLTLTSPVRSLRFSDEVSLANPLKELDQEIVDQIAVNIPKLFFRYLQWRKFVG